MRQSFYVTLSSILCVDRMLFSVPRAYCAVVGHKGMCAYTCVRVSLSLRFLWTQSIIVRALEAAGHAHASRVVFGGKDSRLCTKNKPLLESKITRPKKVFMHKPIRFVEGKQ